MRLKKERKGVVIQSTVAFLTICNFEIIIIATCPNDIEDQYN